MARAHLSPPFGALNDPTGLWRDDDARWHVAYQLNVAGLNPSPTGPGGGPKHWAHAWSDDLLDWEHGPVLLAPSPGFADADGCWSGSTVVDDDRLLLFYTGVRRRAGGWDESVCLAELPTDRLDAAATDKRVLVATAPAGLGMEEFRDPHVVLRDGTATMLVGGGGADRGAVASFASTDLERWEPTGLWFDGDRALAAGMPEHLARAVWECPQLVWIDRHPVLVISVDRPPRPVVYVVGEPGLDRFEPVAWGLLDEGPDVYAWYCTRPAAEDRALGVGWVPGPARANGSSGHLTLPRRLSLDGSGRVRSAPVVPAGDIAATLPPAVIEATVRDRLLVELVDRTERPLLALEVGGDGAGLVCRGEERRLDVGDMPVPVCVVLDPPVAEVVVDGTALTLHLGPIGVDESALRVDGEASVRGLGRA